MKRTILLTALLLTNLRAEAAKEIIHCFHQHGGDTMESVLTESLKVSEVSLGRYEVEVFQCKSDCRNPRDTYYRKNPIYRNFSGSRPAMTFSKDDMRVLHIFGQELYYDSVKAFEFADSACTIAPPEDRGLIVGFADLEPGPCGTPTAGYEQTVRDQALASAEKQCPYKLVRELQEIQVESFCRFQGQGNLYLRAAGLFACDFP